MRLNIRKMEKRLEELNLGKYEFADKMGVRPAWVYILFKDHQSHTFKTVEKLAKALELSPLDLIL